jgi:hypothetical protein
MPVIKIVPMPGVPVPGPRGEQGPRGYQGDTGLTGPQGPAFEPDGASGTFISQDNKTITVVNGIITAIAGA